MRKIAEISSAQEEKLINIWTRFNQLQSELHYVNTNEPSKYILSFGAGRQTWALLLKLTKLFRRNPNAFVVFADTGGEHQETYDYLNTFVLPYCKTNSIQFVRVYNKYGKTLYEYCWDKKIVPSIKFRDCTSKFKIAPIRKFIREQGVSRKNPCYVFIGISYDEADRMHVSNVQYAKSVYPFVDGFRNFVESEITVVDCERIISEFNFPPIPKSGCWFCPFAQPQDLLNIRYVDQTIKLEERNTRFPEIKLRGMGDSVKTVRELSVSDLTMETCKSGYCMI